MPVEARESRRATHVRNKNLPDFYACCMSRSAFDNLEFVEVQLRPINQLICRSQLWEDNSPCARLWEKEGGGYVNRRQHAESKAYIHEVVHDLGSLASRKNDGCSSNYLPH